ncbi:hypothetical protein PAPYR_11818 [Paratrimastix pyriformis]|uniref:Uncharacterized protein n=1 Tax=Paratrimastix pyriformis TaxID=342808 RepID=A0ABQ8U8I1_9EUKA|nr:hypothetical protein PAPYR_11818 [Paratrimastix pyriformis]
MQLITDPANIIKAYQIKCQEIQSKQKQLQTQMSIHATLFGKNMDHRLRFLRTIGIGIEALDGGGEGSDGIGSILSRAFLD